MKGIRSMFRCLMIMLFMMVIFALSAYCHDVNGASNKAVSEDVAKVYREKIATLEKKYGKYSEEKYEWGMPDQDWIWAKGLSYLQLIDFDKDGQSELFAVWNNGKEGDFYEFAVYTVKNGKCKRIGHESVGADGSPAIFWFGISEYNGKPCVLTSAGITRLAYGYQDKKIKLIFDGFKDTDDKYWNDVEDLTKKTVKRYNLNGVSDNSMGNEWRMSSFGKKSLKNGIKNTKKILK